MKYLLLLLAFLTFGCSKYEPKSTLVKLHFYGQNTPYSIVYYSGEDIVFDTIYTQNHDVTVRVYDDVFDRSVWLNTMVKNVSDSIYVSGYLPNWKGSSFIESSLKIKPLNGMSRVSIQLNLAQ